MRLPFPGRWYPVAFAAMVAWPGFVAPAAEGAIAASGEKGLLEQVMASHAGTTSDEFAQIVRDWAKTATHPVSKRRYVDLTYKPMRKLLDYLRANGFKTCIVSGGGVEFLRVLSQDLYGIPPEQVIDSSVKTKCEVRDGRPVIVRLPEFDFVDDEAGKRGWLVVGVKSDWRTNYASVR